MNTPYQTILVTGGAGFIGSHLVDSLLMDGKKVIVIDDLSTGKRSNIPSEAEFVQADITNYSIVHELMREADACYHLAAVASVVVCEEQWQFAHQTNLIGTLNVLSAARVSADQPAKPVIYASSAAVYGNQTILPLTEELAVHPISNYGADKLGCEIHAFVASSSHGVPTIGFRFFNVYGPRQDPKSPYSGVISIFMDRIKQKQSITIYGDGEQTRDFVYVGDLVKILKASLNQVTIHPKVYNICTGRATRVLDVANTIMSVAGLAVPIQYQPAKAGDIRHSLGAPHNMEHSFSMSADTSLTDGLTKLYTYQANA